MLGVILDIPNINMVEHTHMCNTQKISNLDFSTSPVYNGGMSMIIPEKDKNQPLAEIEISPEDLEISKMYLMTLDISETADNCQVNPSEVNAVLRKKGVREFVNTVMTTYALKDMDSITRRMESLVEKKLEELEEAEATSSKDIADLLAIQQKLAKDRFDMAMKLIDAQKENGPKSQNNTQINIGDNIASLLNKIGKK